MEPLAEAKPHKYCEINL